jgi:vacuolar-type H+-ATPase subunit F/Vma7
MGILDGIVEWIAEQVMAGLDLVTTSVLGALGCDMAVFLRYFPAAETMYSVFVALAIGIILLTEALGKKYPELVKTVRTEHKKPLLIEIPDRHGTGRRPDFITAYVNDAIGLKL